MNKLGSWSVPDDTETSLLFSQSQVIIKMNFKSFEDIQIPHKSSWLDMLSSL